MFVVVPSVLVIAANCPTAIPEAVVVWPSSLIVAVASMVYVFDVPSRFSAVIDVLLMAVILPWKPLGPTSGPPPRRWWASIAVVVVPSLLVTAANSPTVSLSAVEGCLSMVTVVDELIV